MSKKWISVWKMPQVKLGLFSMGLSNKTLRFVLKSEVSGNAVRIALSNELGKSYIRVNAASVALCDAEGVLLSDAVTELLFEEKSKVIISAGKTVMSDDVKLDVPEGAYLAVSVHFDTRGTVAAGNLSTQKMLVSKRGDYTKTRVIKPDVQIRSKLNKVIAKATKDDTDLKAVGLVSEVQLFHGGDSASVVVFGDTVSKYSGWLELFGQKLQEAYPNRYALVDSSIAGNRLLHDSAVKLPKQGAYGKSGMSRFEADVLKAKGVSHVILQLGVQDIIQPDTSAAPLDEAVIAQQIVNGLKKLAKQAREADVKMIACTLPPFKGIENYNDEIEKRRTNINVWMREKAEMRFDGLIDLDAALRYAKDENQLSPKYDSGDHATPNAAGGEAIAEAIDIGLFE